MEGSLDEAVVVRLIHHVGAVAGTMHGGRGKTYLDGALTGFNRAARRAPWVVLRDLDHDAACAPELASRLLPERTRLMCFRVAVREVEAWLLADRREMARFLGVAQARMPGEPDSLPDPKQTLINVARRSRHRFLREDLVPREESGRSEGPAYSSRLAEFVSAAWRPDAAAENSDSLTRAIRSLDRLVRQAANA